MSAFDKTARDAVAAVSAQAMIYRATTNSGSVNALTEPGTYIIQAGVTDLPGGATSGLLTVYDFAGEEFVVQSFITTSSSQIGVRYERIVRPGVSVPGWTDTSIVPNSTIDRAKLVSAYSAKGAVNSGSLGALVDTGVYVIQSGVSDIPGGLTSGLLDVENSGDFVRQSFYSSTSSAIRVKYERIIRPSTSSYPAWQDLSVPIDGAVSRSKLTASFAYNAAASSGSINALTAEGSYTIQDGVTDLPSGVTTGLMIVDNFADYIRQTLFTATSSQLTTQYQRIIRPSTSSYPGWQTISGAVADSSISRAKLAASFSLLGGVSSGTPDALTSTGIYVIQTGVTGLPGSLTSGLLEVHSYGDFIRQSFYSTTSSGIQTKYERLCRVSTSSFPGWTQINAMTRSNLNATFASNGTASTGSFNDYFSEGHYTVGAALTDAPSGAPTTGLLTCRSFGGTFVIQEYVSSTASAVLTVWKRTIRPGVSYGAWSKDVPVSHGAASRWSGKNVAFVGDSIFRMVSSTWVASVAADLGLANGYQGGVAGCTMGRRQFSGDALNDYLRELGATKLVDAMVSGDWTAPIAAATYCRDNGGDTQLLPAVTALSTVSYSTLAALLIGFGTNDFGCSLPIGSDADTDWTTFKGAINYVVSTFQTAYPSCRLMFTAPLWRARNAAGDGNDADLVPNSGGIYLREYADAVIDRAQAHKIPVLDNYRESGINKYNASTMFSDGLHPWTVPGNQRMTDKITAFMERSY